jgi:thiosulfate sulfurtransferase
MSYEDLHVNQVEGFLQQPDAIVIDIRDIRSYRAGHMKNALHIDGPTMGLLISQRKNNPPVLVYCYHGNSSRDMAEMISRMGFRQVSHLVGGWEAWSQYQTQASHYQPAFNPQFAEAFA